MSTVENQQSITEQGDPRKPQGEAGAIMLGRMNQSHYEVTGWALDFLGLSGSDRVLDIGCGGGETLNRMAAHITDGSIAGADHSSVSVRLSSERNCEHISSGKMRIVEASVESLPFADNSFDKIITVESFYFWPNPQENLHEVLRVLDKNGIFLIVADIHGGAQLTENERENIKKYGLFNPTPDEFRLLLENAGFSRVKIHTKSGTSWICAEGRKF